MFARDSVNCKSELDITQKGEYQHWLSFLPNVSLQTTPLPSLPSITLCETILPTPSSPYGPSRYSFSMSSNLSMNASSEGANTVK